MRIYISGPMSGIKNYKDVFRKAKEKLEAAGYDKIVNPAEVELYIGSGFTYDEILNLDLDILGHCSILVQLPGWEKSKGACVEYGYAKARDMITVRLEDLVNG